MKCGVFLYVYTDCGLVSLARLRPIRGRRTRIKYVIGLTDLAEAFRHKVVICRAMEEDAASGATASTDTMEDDEHGSKESVLFKYFLKEWEVVKTILDRILASGGVADPADVHKIRSIVRLLHPTWLCFPFLF
ncbi:hypothetical protein Taro_043464 [Colocasia esculenta]|uniref:Uncharacterized protein n=1 Tax=Colocasia esculenta TaxID=4460 RepID=A0A843WGJ4_COLES|nr:hypothetical protein [Colocasia esculenta]